MELDYRNNYRIPACMFLIDIQVLIDERRFLACFDPEEESEKEYDQ